MKYMQGKQLFFFLNLFFCILVFSQILKIVLHDPVICPEYARTSQFMITPSTKIDVLKIFNLSVTELGMYRPRVISFLSQYIDSNFNLYINQFFPNWGSRLIGYYIALCFIVLSLLKLTKQLFPDSTLSLRLVLSLIPLTWLNTFWTIIVTLRSAKLLCVACIIYLFSVFIEAREWQNDSRQRMALFGYSSLFVLFYLIDEQVITFAALFIGCSVLLSFKERKLKAFVLYGLCSFIMYMVLYYTFLKYLFLHFTPDFSSTHVHNSHLLNTNFSWGLISETMKKYVWVLSNNFSFLLFFLIAGLIKSAYQKEATIFFLIVFIIAGTLVNTVGLALMHPPIVTFFELKVSMYYLPLLTVFYCLILYVIKELFISTKLPYIGIACIILVSLINLARVDYVWDVIKSGNLGPFVSKKIEDFRT